MDEISDRLDRQRIITPSRKIVLPKRITLRPNDAFFRPVTVNDMTDDRYTVETTVIPGSGTFMIRHDSQNPKHQTLHGFRTRIIKGFIGDKQKMKVMMVHRSMT